MTHNKIVYEVTHSFSPVSLKDAERFARLEKNLGVSIRQNGISILPETFEELPQWNQSGKTVISANRNLTPGLWVFGLKLTTPCV